jgi:hypothetical protein
MLRAEKAINKVEPYIKTLTEIITNHKFRKYLDKLEHVSFNELKAEAHEIEKLFNDLTDTVKILNSDLKQLKDILERVDSEKWFHERYHMTMEISKRFTDERGELHHLFEIAVHEKHELK